MTSGDIFDCPDGVGGATVTWWAEAKDAAQHLTMHGMAPHPGEGSGLRCQWCGSIASVLVCFCLQGLKLTPCGGLFALSSSETCPTAVPLPLWVLASAPTFPRAALSTRGPPTTSPNILGKPHQGQKQPEILFPAPCSCPGGPPSQALPPGPTASTPPLLPVFL